MCCVFVLHENIEGHKQFVISMEEYEVHDQGMMPFVIYINRGAKTYKIIKKQTGVQRTGIFLQAWTSVGEDAMMHRCEVVLFLIHADEYLYVGHNMVQFCIPDSPVNMVETRVWPSLQVKTYLCGQQFLYMIQAQKKVDISCDFAQYVLCNDKDPHSVMFHPENAHERNLDTKISPFQVRKLQI